MKIFLIILTSILSLVFLYFAYIAYLVFSYVSHQPYRCGLADIGGYFGVMVDLILLPLLIWLYVKTIRLIKKQRVRQ